MHGGRTEVEALIVDVDQSGRVKHRRQRLDVHELVGRTLQIVIGPVLVDNDAAHQRDQLTEVELPTSVNHGICGLRRF